MINELDIVGYLSSPPPSTEEVGRILTKSMQLERLTIGEVASLLLVDDEVLLSDIFNTARRVKELIYGRRVVIFAPLYISNLCANECLYCAFRASNRSAVRRALTQDEIASETTALLKTGQKRILLVAGESYPKEGLDYVFNAIDTVYGVRDGKNNIRRLNVNLAPLEVDQFKRLKDKQIGTYQLFQETYHLPTYKKMHVGGPKANYEYRLTAIGRAFMAGIEDVGIGVLFGLYDYKYEVLALMSHIDSLENEFGMGPHTISIPRMEPASGSDVSTHPPYPVNDMDFKKIIAILRLAVPYTGIILSTRENAAMRLEALELGVSQISAGSRTSPGGYSNDKSEAQFSLGDHRPLDEVIVDVCKSGHIPSFCTGCYRTGRTGLDFMEQAKPGAIKMKCAPNAVYTFQEYLDDFGTTATLGVGQKIISDEVASMPEKLRNKVESTLQRVKQGERDIYV